MQEQRQLKVSFNKSGGTAGKGGITNRITIPTMWIKEMDISLEDREITATFENNKIIIEKGNKNESL